MRVAVVVALVAMVLCAALLGGVACKSQAKANKDTSGALRDAPPGSPGPGNTPPVGGPQGGMPAKMKAKTMR